MPITQFDSIKSRISAYCLVIGDNFVIVLIEVIIKNFYLNLFPKGLGVDFIVENIFQSLLLFSHAECICEKAVLEVKKLIKKLISDLPVLLVERLMEK